MIVEANGPGKSFREVKRIVSVKGNVLVFFFSFLINYYFGGQFAVINYFVFLSCAIVEANGPAKRVGESLAENSNVTWGYITAGFLLYFGVGNIVTTPLLS